MQTNAQVKKAKIKQKSCQKLQDKMPHTRISIMMLTINKTTYLS